MHKTNDMNKSLIYFDEEDFQNSIDLLVVVNQIYKDSEYEKNLCDKILIEIFQNV